MVFAIHWHEYSFLAAAPQGRCRGYCPALPAISSPRWPQFTTADSRNEQEHVWILLFPESQTGIQMYPSWRGSSRALVKSLPSFSKVRENLNERCILFHFTCQRGPHLQEFGINVLYECSLRLPRCPKCIPLLRGPPPFLLPAVISSPDAHPDAKETGMQQDT